MDYYSRFKKVGIAYVIMLILSLTLFALEENCTIPSGLGIIFGPFNYYYLIYENGVMGFGIFINGLTLLLIAILCLIPRPFVWWCLLIFSIFWFMSGLFAHVYETESPFY